MRQTFLLFSKTVVKTRFFVCVFSCIIVKVGENGNCEEGVGLKQKEKDVE